MNGPDLRTTSTLRQSIHSLKLGSFSAFTLVHCRIWHRKRKSRNVKKGKVVIRTYAHRIFHTNTVEYTSTVSLSSRGCSATKSSSLRHLSPSSPLSTLAGPSSIASLPLPIQVSEKSCSLLFFSTLNCVFCAVRLRRFCVSGSVFLVKFEDRYFLGSVVVWDFLEERRLVHMDVKFSRILVSACCRM